jgi:uncharacterized UBP type Zn finger protein
MADKRMKEYPYEPINNTICPHCQTVRQYYVCNNCGAASCSEYGCGTVVVNRDYCHEHMPTTSSGTTI